MASTPRTTSALVRGVLRITKATDMAPFITAANMLVTRACGASGYSDDGEGSEMEVIERWLAAHFYSVNDNQLSAAKAGSVGAAFQHKVDLGLADTQYGQQAMILDTAGNLAAINNSAKTKRKITVSGNWSGTDWSEVVDYCCRSYWR